MAYNKIVFRCVMKNIWRENWSANWTVVDVWNTVKNNAGDVNICLENETIDIKCMPLQSITEWFVCKPSVVLLPEHVSLLIYILSIGNIIFVPMRTHKCPPKSLSCNEVTGVIDQHWESYKWECEPRYERFMSEKICRVSSNDEY